MKIKGFLYAVVSALFFGCAGLFVKKGYSDNFSPVDLLMLQYIIATVLLFFLCLVKYKNKFRLTKKTFKKLLVQGVLGNTLMTVCYYMSFKYLDMAVATMLLFTYPAMVSISSYFIFRIRLSKITLFSICGTFVGCLLVLDLFSNHPHKCISIVGIIYALLSAAFYAFMNIYAESIVEDVPGMVITFYTTVFTLAVLVLFHFGFIFKLSHLSNASVINAAMLSFFCEIIPLTLLYEAIKIIGSVPTSIISSLELPASALTAFLFLHENLSMTQLAGVILVIFCVIKLKNEPQPTKVHAGTETDGNSRN